jgi:hypothetical protein
MCVCEDKMEFSNHFKNGARPIKPTKSREQIINFVCLKEWTLNEKKDEKNYIKMVI